MERRQGLTRQEGPERSAAGVGATLLASHARRIDGLLERAEAARWGVSRARFVEALERSAAKHFRGERPSPAEVAAYLESLHVSDLALACACSDGKEPAWEHFVAHFRHELHSAARAILGCRADGAGEVRALELADSLFAELYGLGQVQGRRRSLFDYFHGRSKLSTWLRAVLAQRHVDMLRSGQRTESLEEKDETAVAEILRAHGSVAAPDPDRTRYLWLLQAALESALSALEARDRLRLALYYAQEKTLAEIGRILGEHEATASRNLERTRRALRNHVEHFLREGPPSADGAADARGLSEAQVRLSFEYALEEWPFDLSEALSKEGPAAKPNATKLGREKP